MLKDEEQDRCRIIRREANQLSAVVTEFQQALGDCRNILEQMYTRALANLNQLEKSTSNLSNELLEIGKKSVEKLNTNGEKDVG